MELDYVCVYIAEAPCYLREHFLFGRIFYNIMGEHLRLFDKVRTILAGIHADFKEIERSQSIKLVKIENRVRRRLGQLAMELDQLGRNLH